MWKGMGVSPGIAIGKVFLLKKENIEADKSVYKEETEKELQKLNNGLNRVRKSLAEVWEKAKGQVGEDAAEIFNTHLHILQDSQYIRKIEKEITENGLPAITAVRQVTEEFEARFESMEDEYFRDRLWDVRDIGNQIVQGILNVVPNLPRLPEGDIIIVTDELTPVDTLFLGSDRVVGFVTAKGGRNSHAAILARSMEIPAVVGMDCTSIEWSTNKDIFIDGGTGEIVVNPDQGCYDKLRQWQQQRQEQQDILCQEDIGFPHTIDQEEVYLDANMDVLEEMDKLVRICPHGIGLIRTESLFLTSNIMNDEDQQYKIYRRIAQKAEGRPVVFRTMDIGGDKPFGSLAMDTDDSFLGCRGIRINLRHPHTLIPQIKAVLRAAVHGSLSIMFPMISNLEEWRKVRALVSEAAHDLAVENKDYNMVPLGMMVEVPGAALMIDAFAREVDFFSIGTNDLCQYLLAVDRSNESVQSLYQPFHPSMLRIIRMVVEKSRELGVPVSLCGEMASDLAAVPLLLGLGLRQLSMSLSALPRVSRFISRLEMSKCRRVTLQAMEMDTAQEIEALVQTEFNLLKADKDLEIHTEESR